MSKLRPRHDALFRATFGRREHVRGLLRHWLPPKLEALVDWGSLELVDPTGFDRDLGPHFSDLVFSVELRRAPMPPGLVPRAQAARLKAQGRPRKLLVCLLVEHQSSGDPLIVWRMQRYISGIQQRYLKDPEYAALPVVLPILISNARRCWPYALDLHSAYPGELEAFPEIWPHVAQLRIILDDLPATSIEELLDRQLTDMAVVALCMLRDALVFKRLNRAIPLWIPRLRRVREQDREDYNTLVEYLGTATRPEQIDALRVTIRREAPDMAQEIVSTLDHYMAKGRAEGRVEGRVEGRSEMLQRQLTLKFGQLPEWVLQRLQSSSVEQLDSYADRILTAESLEETLEA